MSKYPVAIFDMDGTLIDSARGILNGIKHALERLEMELPENFDIRPCIGPPLNYSFKTMLNVPQGKIEEAIAIYRSYYGEAGAFEADLYPGIKSLLEELNESGAVVCLATSKYSVMAEKMMDHFHIRHLFRHVAMADIAQFRSAKKEMILDILNRCKQTPDGAVMIGDTHFDAEGAVAAGLDFIGVLYGYGRKEEMERAGGRRFAADIQALKNALINQPS